MRNYKKVKNNERTVLSMVVIYKILKHLNEQKNKGNQIAGGCK